eukprot:bmy_03206T0
MKRQPEPVRGKLQIFQKMGKEPQATGGWPVLEYHAALVTGDLDRLKLLMDQFFQDANVVFEIKKDEMEWQVKSLATFGPSGLWTLEYKRELTTPLCIAAAQGHTACSSVHQKAEFHSPSGENLPKISAAATTIQHFRSKLNGSCCSKGKRKDGNGQQASLSISPLPLRICPFTSAVSIASPLCPLPAPVPALPSIQPICLPPPADPGFGLQPPCPGDTSPAHLPLRQLRGGKAAS